MFVQFDKILYGRKNIFFVFPLNGSHYIGRKTDSRIHKIVNDFVFTAKRAFGFASVLKFFKNRVLHFLQFREQHFAGFGVILQIVPGRNNVHFTGIEPENEKTSFVEIGYELSLFVGSGVLLQHIQIYVKRKSTQNRLRRPYMVLQICRKIEIMTFEKLDRIVFVSNNPVFG